MPPVDIDLATGSHESRSLSLLAQQSINVFPVIVQAPGAASRSGLFNTDGITQFTTTGSGVGRGWIKHKEELYSVNGTTLYKIDSAGTVTSLGTITGSSRCSIAENGQSIAIVVPGTTTGYFYDTTNGLLEINAINFSGTGGSVYTGSGNVNSVVEKDFYYIFSRDDNFFNSSLASDNLGRSFNALDFGTAEVSTDKIVRVATVQDELVVFGESTLEIFQNVGGTGFPFQRTTGAHVSKGICSRFGFIEFDNSYVYIGNSKDERPAIWRGTSGGATKISTDAIDSQLNALTQAQLEAVFAWTYSLDGYYFVGFTLPATTFVYDGTASALSNRPIWHERQTSGSRWRVNDVINIYKKILVQDNVDGRIGQISSGTYQEYTTDVTRTYISQYVQNSGKRLFNPSCELHLEQAATTNNLAFPTIELLISDDGARTFNSAGTRSLGRVTQNNKRVTWNRLGSSPLTRAYKFTTTANQKIALQKLTLELESVA